MKKSFASDNWSGVCPEIMEALREANAGHNQAYGELNDPWSERTFKAFQHHFGNDIRVFFVYNGTAANVLGISHLMRSYHAVVAAKSAHLNEDECAAPEKSAGTKILEIETKNGKITPFQAEPFLHSIGFQHHAQPKVITVSQVTEMGTVYTPEEIKELAAFAHSHNMYLHMDGARIANAAVALDMDFKKFTKDAGVDVLSFGGTKNGLMFGEAVVFFDQSLATDFEYTRKQGMQLHSKMRYIAAQFERYLINDLWKKNAQNANNMAKLLAKQIDEINGIKRTQPVNANGVFVIMPPQVITEMQEHYFFHVWNEQTSEVRLMCSWDTNEEDIKAFIGLLKEEMQKTGIK